MFKVLLVSHVECGACWRVGCGLVLVQIETPESLRVCQPLPGMTRILIICALVAGGHHVKPGSTSNPGQTWDPDPVHFHRDSPAAFIFFGIIESQVGLFWPTVGKRQIVVVFCSLRHLSLIQCFS